MLDTATESEGPKLHVEKLTMHAPFYHKAGILMSCGRRPLSPTGRSYMLTHDRRPCRSEIISVSTSFFRAFFEEVKRGHNLLIHAGLRLVQLYYNYLDSHFYHLRGGTLA
jgi:hypothetical protein